MDDPVHQTSNITDLSHIYFDLKPAIPGTRRTSSHHHPINLHTAVFPGPLQ